MLVPIGEVVAVAENWLENGFEIPNIVETATFGKFLQPEACVFQLVKTAEKFESVLMIAPVGLV